MSEFLEFIGYVWGLGWFGKGWLLATGALLAYLLGGALLDFLFPEVTGRPKPKISPKREVVWTAAGESFARVDRRTWQRECSHWPRDPVTISTGEQVAFICRKCDAVVVNEAWLRAEDLTNL